jgi:uncharacterized iron-regulated protein
MKRNSKAGERRSAAQMHALAAVRREIVLRDSCGGRKYLREFTQAFRQYDKALNPEEVDHKINDANIVLIGDYHALAASQRYAASLIEKVASKRPVVLCVEAVLSRDQGILDSWWRREIGEQELRKRLRFDREWGYEWQPFYELLSSARDHAEAIYGLDCMPRDDMRRIRSRDRHAAAKIAQARREHPNAAILVLFGESHLAPEHLPRVLKESLPAESVLTILQNLDAMYWQAVGENAAAVSLGSDVVCVFNSSPLEKYESYRLCLERWNGDDQTDFAPAVYNVIFSLARTLGFRLDSPHNGSQPKYLADSLPEVVNVVDGATDDVEQLTGDARGATPFRLDNDGCRYVPETNQFFIREFKMPQVAAEAARFLRHACRGMEHPASSQGSDTQAALARFGARLLCPEAADELDASLDGEELYKSYISGRVSKATVRKMFLRP